MKKLILIFILMLSLVGIFLRSGIVGGIYYLVCGTKSQVSINAEEIYDRDEAPFGEIYPSFQIMNVGHKKVTVSSKSGKVANITKVKTPSDIQDKNSLRSTATGYGDSAFWWEYGNDDSYTIRLKTSKYGVVLEQKKITLKKTMDSQYHTYINNSWDCFDIPLLISLALFLGSFIVLIYPQIPKQKKKSK